MNVTDAAYHTAHDYPGGCETLAKRMDMPSAVLRGKVNPKNPRNRLALEEADLMMGLTGDFRILRALAANHGKGLLDLSEPGSGESITSSVLQLDIAEGDLSRAIHDAIADQKISTNDASVIANAGMEVQRVLLALLAQLRAPAQRAAGTSVDP